MVDTLNGRYSFRSGGFDDAGNQSYFLLGVGVMILKDGTLTGWHRSAIMPMDNGVTTAAQLGSEAVQAALFSLNGTYERGKHDIWELSVKFECERPKQIMKSTFVCVCASPGTLWLASHGSTVLGPRKKFVPVGEMAMGEAVKVGEAEG